MCKLLQFIKYNDAIIRMLKWQVSFPPWTLNTIKKVTVILYFKCCACCTAPGYTWLKTHQQLVMRDLDESP